MFSSCRFCQRVQKAAQRRLGWGMDFLSYRHHLRPYAAMIREAKQGKDRPGLLIVSGNGMNVMWAQVWPMLSLPLRTRGYRGLVLTTRRQRLLRAYYRLFQLEPLYLEDMTRDATIPEALRPQVEAATSIETYRDITYKDAPIGQIALSTYSRNIGTGVIQFSPDVHRYVRDWIGRLCNMMDAASELFRSQQITTCFFTEVFMEEYGAFYYAALNAKLNVIRFAGTVRDDAFIMQHLSHDNDRIHHSSIDPTTWERIKHRSDDAKVDAELMQNFNDRYGAKWHRSKRNHPNTQVLDVAEARKTLGVAEGRKVAVIYSHILYDTLFFFGTDLFKDYSEWLIESTRAAIANPHIDWLIKVHPSNLWRGEIDTLLKGKYEEERLIYDTFGTLPPHVRIIGADTKINPFTWFQLADYGITVRGTSGLEMAALGKTVVTAGTGRYEGNGFTTDPATAEEYMALLKNLHTLPPQSTERQQLAKRYAHAIFVMKPYTLSAFDARKRFGCKTVYASDDLVYFPKPPADAMPNLTHFADWAANPAIRDLLTGDV